MCDFILLYLVFGVDKSFFNKVNMIMKGFMKILIILKC